MRYPICLSGAKLEISWEKNGNLRETVRWELRCSNWVIFYENKPLPWSQQWYPCCLVSLRREKNKMLNPSFSKKQATPKQPERALCRRQCISKQGNSWGCEEIIKVNKKWQEQYWNGIWSFWTQSWCLNAKGASLFIAKVVSVSPEDLQSGGIFLSAKYSVTDGQDAFPHLSLGLLAAGGVPRELQSRRMFLCSSKSPPEPAAKISASSQHCRFTPVRGAQLSPL